jgi:UDP-N-acetylglucosamine--N-acetylmuramyl-(pentapeptide) pyrophosphoryl-undecaprenol N-acetylglucosamine transferase
MGPVMRPVMVMAGGTGGHVFPALAAAQRLRERGAEVFWLGSRKGLEARLVPEQGIAMEWIQVEGLRGSGLKRWLKAPLMLSLALLQAFRVIRRRRPAVALGMGGFAAGPGGLMARLLGVPLVVHEQNKVPGLTNQWLARIATRVFEAFPGSFPPQRHARACGNPVRREIAALAPPAERFAGRSGALRLLVLGGSLGARVLNETVPGALALLEPGIRPRVRHQAGSRTLEAARSAYREAGVEAQVTPFIEEMAEAYGWADLVIGRAGALTLSELAAAGVGALLVPYPHAVDDHQTKNAAWLTEAGAAVLLPQSQLSPQRLAALLQPFAEERGKALALAEAARSRAMTEAAETVAGACLEVAKP